MANMTDMLVMDTCWLLVCVCVKTGQCVESWGQYLSAGSLITITLPHGLFTESKYMWI